MRIRGLYGFRALALVAALGACATLAACTVPPSGTDAGTGTDADASTGATSASMTRSQGAGGLGRVLGAVSLLRTGRVVDNFSHMDRTFASVTMPVPRAAPLPKTARPVQMPPGFDAWIAKRKVTSIVVLAHGRLAYEGYFLGTEPTDRRISWSLAKSFLGTLTGTAVARGEIGALDDPVTRYVPALTGSAYDGSTIRNLLNMASGVAFDESYSNPFSDINKMNQALVFGGDLDPLPAGLTERWAAPGQHYRYSSMDSYVLAMALRAATGQSVPELMRTRIFAPLRLERDPYFLVDGAGHAFVSGGLGLTTRDTARFAQMVLDGGQAGGVQIVPRGWIAEMTAANGPEGRTGGPGGGFGYHWWIPKNPRPGEVFSRGFMGQRIWIDRRAGVVIVLTAADRNEGAPGVKKAERAMFRAIVEALR